MRVLMEKALRMAIEGRKRFKQVQMRRRLQQSRERKPVEYNKLF